MTETCVQRFCIVEMFFPEFTWGHFRAAAMSPAPSAPRQPPRQVSTARDDTPPDPPPAAGGRAFVGYIYVDIFIQR